MQFKSSCVQRADIKADSSDVAISVYKKEQTSFFFVVVVVIVVGGCHISIFGNIVFKFMNNSVNFFFLSLIHI